MEERRPETRRRVRRWSGPVLFIGGLLVIAAVVAAIILVVWAIAGFGEGSEGV
jgi:hypothetical protein